MAIRDVSLPQAKFSKIILDKLDFEPIRDGGRMKVDGPLTDKMAAVATEEAAWARAVSAAEAQTVRAVIDDAKQRLSDGDILVLKQLELLEQYDIRAGPMTYLYSTVMSNIIFLDESLLDPANRRELAVTLVYEAKRRSAGLPLKASSLRRNCTRSRSKSSAQRSCRSFWQGPSAICPALLR